MPEEKISFAIRSYTGPKHPGINVDVFLEPLMQDMEILWKEVIDIIFTRQPLILEPLYSSPSMITRHYLSCQDRS
jgi:hypothetical protein